MRFLNTASPPNQSPGLKALLFHPLTPPRSSLLLLPSPSGLTWLPASSLSKRCSLIHRSYTFLWQEGFGKNGIAPCQNGVYSTETFPHFVLPPAAPFQSVWTFTPYPNPNKDTPSTNYYTKHSKSIKMVSSGQFLTLQRNQTQNSGHLINTGVNTLPTQPHRKGFLFTS